eukprot:547533_1
MAREILFCLDFADSELLSAFILIVICGATLTFLAPYFIYKSLTEDLRDSWRKLYIANCIFFVMCGAGYTVHMGLAFREILCITSEELLATGWFGYGGYTTGTQTLYLLFLFRINLMFQNSAYSLNKYILYGTTSLIVVNWILYMVGGVFYTISSDPHHKGAKRVGATCSIISVVIILIIGAIFITKTHQLYKNMLLTHDDAYGDESGRIPTNESGGTNLKGMLLAPAIKFCVCTSIALVTTLVALFWSLYRTDIVEDDTTQHWYWHVVITQMDALVNIASLALQFAWAQSIYLSLCGCCQKHWIPESKTLDERVTSTTQMETTL